HNDLPLLEQVANPVAVDPDATLEREARERGWPVISLR
ncbi:MAG: HAD-IB family hydrolase, partial [Pseudomonadales bacterium]|nr:HAD-IB family hydrolase [Pseudomonadales bacterium]